MWKLQFLFEYHFKWPSIQGHQTTGGGKILLCFLYRNNTLLSLLLVHCTFICCFKVFAPTVIFYVDIEQILNVQLDVLEALIKQCEDKENAKEGWFL